MPIVQSHAPLRARCAHECLMFEPTKGECQVVKEEHRVVVTSAQCVPERGQAQQYRGMQDHLLWRVEEILVQDDDIVDDLPAVEQPGRIRRHQQVDARLGIALAHRAQRRCGEQEIADARELDDQDMGLLRQGDMFTIIRKICLHCSTCSSPSSLFWRKYFVIPGSRGWPWLLRPPEIELKRAVLLEAEPLIDAQTHIGWRQESYAVPCRACLVQGVAYQRCPYAPSSGFWNRPYAVDTRHACMQE